MAETTLAGAVRQVRSRLAAQQHRELDDRQLLERFLQLHDESAFAALVKRHERLVCGALTKVLTDPADVEDAFQATFLVLVRKARSIRWQQGLGTWLYAVAHRVAVHARGQARKRSRHEERAASRVEQPAPSPDVSLREACDLVHEELERLPEALRAPVLWCYLEGKSRDEVAEQLGVTVGTVKGRLERGRNLLRERLLRRGVPLTVGLLVALTHSAARASSPALIQAAVAAASGPSARVAALAQGVSTTMVLSKFKLALGMALIVGALGALLGSGGEPARVSARSEPAAGEPAKAGEVAGRVIDDKGEPLAGATVTLWVNAKTNRKVGETGADGRFRFVPNKDEQAGKLIAQAKGLGADWASLRDRAPGEITLRLEEDVPIQGRVLNLEGRPIEGVTVKVQEAMRSRTADLTPYLDAYKKINSGVAIPRLVTLPPEALGLPKTVTTGKDGRFRLAGAGRERAVSLYIQGRGVETQWFTAITRPGMKGKTGYFRGPEFDVLVGPGKALTGVVKEKESGKPVAGARVTCGTGEATTDGQGRYRIEGLTKRSDYIAFVQGPRHFSTMAQLKDTPGLDTMTADFEVLAGVYVEGVLREKGTGKPVSGQINYYIASDNPHLKSYTFPQGVGMRGGSAGEDGKFRVLVIPGRGWLAATADKNVYTRGTPDDWDGKLIMATPNALFPYYYHAIKDIDIDPAKTQGARCDLEVDRGITKTGSMVDPDGKPVSDVIVFGLTAVPDPGARTFPRQPRHGEPPPERVKGSTFTAVGLNPKQPRYLVFLQPEKKLGKVQLVRGDEAGELVVKLEPLGAVTGVARTNDGKPAADKHVLVMGSQAFVSYKDLPIDLLANQREQRRMGRLIRWLPEGVKTDAEGKFRVEGLLPGLKYTLWVSDDASRQRPPSHWQDGVTAESGQVKDLGEVKRARGF